MKSEDNKFRYTTKKNDSKFFFYCFSSTLFLHWLNVFKTSSIETNQANNQSVIIDQRYSRPNEERPSIHWTELQLWDGLFVRLIVAQL